MFMKEKGPKKECYAKKEKENNEKKTRFRERWTKKRKVRTQIAIFFNNCYRTDLCRKWVKGKKKKKSQLKYNKYWTLVQYLFTVPNSKGSIARKSKLLSWKSAKIRTAHFEFQKLRFRVFFGKSDSYLHPVSKSPSNL